MIPAKEELDNALSERHGEEFQQKISGAAVAICGLGGLGSGVAVLLARAGIGRLILIDYDHVDITNLHRQQYKADQIGRYKTDALSCNLKEIAPYTELKTHTVLLTADNAARLLQDADIVCEAFDDAQCKAQLADFVLTKMPEKYFVSGSGMAGMGSANEIRTRRISGHFYICGDETSDVSAEGTLFATRVMLCAAHQAHIILRILAGSDSQ